MSDLFWSVDSLTVKDNVLFGFGWAFHTEQKIVALRFRLIPAAGGRSESIVADYGQPRDKVERVHLGRPYARDSRYVVLGAFSAITPEDILVLECVLADGSIVERTVPSSDVTRFQNKYEGDSGRRVRQQLNMLFKRGMRLIQSGHFSLLFEKVGRYLKGRPTGVLQKPSDLAALLRDKEKENVCLIIDHNLGGGANQYRDRRVDSLIKEGRSAITLTYHPVACTYMLIVKNSRVDRKYAVPDSTFLIHAVKPLSVSEIVYNTAVSFPKPDTIPSLLMQLREITSARLKVLIHDFYLVCPSHFLLNDEGKYCNIPDPGVCEKCLPKNSQGFAALFFERDIHKWRALWGALLTSADEVTAFSKSSAQLLIKAYPQIDASKIAIKPHEVAPFVGPPPQINNTGRLCIGVVGQIGFHKGAVFIRELAREIKRRTLDLKIIVIGQIEATCEASVVRQTGPYRHEALPGLIEASGVNVILFPSIWAETFSYVVQEAMEMQLPVASFNVGAPAERLLAYSKGRVLASMDPASVLDELIEFHRKIYLES